MAYDEYLADRIRQNLKHRRVSAFEKKMMGGLCFMVDEKMCIGIIKNELMVRIDPTKETEVMRNPGCRIMDFTGRPMAGYFFVSPEGTDQDTDLDYWINLCLEFNPLAKSSKKK